MPNTRYIVVLGAGLTQFCIIGALFSYGLLIKEFEVEFGWSRTLLSLSSALATMTMGVLAIAGGSLNDRFGPRRVLSVTGLCFGLGFILLGQISEPWQLFLLFCTLIGLGLGTHDVVTLSTVARWFERHRGIMSGVVKVGTALGQSAIPPLMALLIATYGWRSAVTVLGAGAMVLLLAAALMMQNPPRAPSTPDTVHEDGSSFATARRSRIFWTLCLIQFLFFPTMMAVPLHIAVHGIDLGMSKPLAAGLLSVIGGASLLGRLAVGGLVDRIGGKRAFLFCFVMLTGSLITLINTSAHLPLFITMAFYGFAHGGLFTVVSPTVAGYFGMRAHGAIFGTVLFFGTIGGAIGPVAMGWIFDVTGSYQLAFLGLAIASGFGLLLVLSLPALSREAETVLAGPRT